MHLYLTTTSTGHRRSFESSAYKTLIVISLFRAPHYGGRRARHRPEPPPPGGDVPSSDAGAVPARGAPPRRRGALDAALPGQCRRFCVRPDALTDPGTAAAARARELSVWGPLACNARSFSDSSL